MTGNWTRFLLISSFTAIALGVFFYGFTLSDLNLTSVFQQPEEPAIMAVFKSFLRVDFAKILQAPHLQRQFLSLLHIQAKADQSWKTAKSIYEFSYKDIDGVEQSMEKYRGHVLIIANVATKCGYTKANYEQLGALYEKYSESQGLRILGMPCNQFMSQEPGTETEIKNFVCTNYKIRFDMSSKINVNGDDAHQMWKYLKDRQGGTLLNAAKWNFTKFLIDKKGQPVQRYGPSTEPKDIEKDLLTYFAAAA